MYIYAVTQICHVTPAYKLTCAFLRRIVLWWLGSQAEAFEYTRTRTFGETYSATTWGNWVPKLASIAYFKPPNM